MVLDGFHGFPVINLTRCISALVKIQIHIFKNRKKKAPQLELGVFWVFFTQQSCTSCQCCVLLALSLAE